MRVQSRRSCDDWSATSALLSEARDCIHRLRVCPFTQSDAADVAPFRMRQQKTAAAMSGRAIHRSDFAEDEGEEEEEEIELTNERKSRSSRTSWRAAG